MNAIRVALTVGLLLPLALSRSNALAAAPPQMQTSSDVRVGPVVAPAQHLRGDTQKPVILSLAALLIALDLYEILRHHHHPNQPVSP